MSEYRTFAMEVVNINMDLITGLTRYCRWHDSICVFFDRMTQSSHILQVKTTIQQRIMLTCTFKRFYDFRELQYPLFQIEMHNLLVFLEIFSNRFRFKGELKYSFSS